MRKKGKQLRQKRNIFHPDLLTEAKERNEQKEIQNFYFLLSTCSAHQSEATAAVQQATLFQTKFLFLFFSLNISKKSFN